ncbi:MAG: hypothetical protein KIT22_08670 [Verrucomicrobiae bacterium]|nr:hypothetical protein [Verrucomicrobiae bacterium]
MTSEPSSTTAWQRTTTYRLLRWATNRRTLTRAVFLAAWTATLIALAYGIANWSGRRAWEAERRHLEARGVPVDFTQVIPKPVPDDQNFAATPFVQSWSDRTPRTNISFELFSFDLWKDHYERAKWWVKEPAQTGNQAVNSYRWTDLNSWAAALSFAATNTSARPPRAEIPRPQFSSRAEAATRVLQKFESSEWWRRELQEALKRPETRYPVRYNLDNPWGILLPHLGRIKNACDRLNLRACAHLAVGHPREALEDVTMILELAEGLRSEPFLISYLVRLSFLQIGLQPVWEGLAGHVWTDAELVRLEECLGRIETFTGLDDALAAERTLGFLTIELLANGSYRLGQQFPDVSPSETTPVIVEHFIPRGWYQQEKVEYSRLLEEWKSHGWDTPARRVFPEALGENLRRVESQLGILPGSVDYVNPDQQIFWSLRDLVNHRVLTKFLLREWPRVLPKTAAAQVALDQARIACALERCRLDTKELPDSLSVLAPRYLQPMPKDPLTGADYMYRREANGSYLLYSLGWNLRDDGGTPGASRFDPQDGDWVWSLPADAADL